MKEKFLPILTMSLLTVFFLFSSYNVTLANTTNNIGQLDIINSTTISGWAWNPNEPEKIQDVHIYIIDDSSSKVLSVIPVRADIYRDDLNKLNIGNGKYGFSYNINWNNIPYANIYSVKAYLVNGNNNPQLDGNLSYSIDHTINSKIGTFTATAYCSCRRCTPGFGLTATGTKPTANHTIAVDPRVIPLGSKILINGTVYTAEDTGSGVKRNHIDIYFNTHIEAIIFGKQRVTAFSIVE
jgi:Uncharacterized protein conserved in bacteria